MNPEAQQLFDAMTPLQQRIARLQIQARISEHNRRVRLEARPDAAQRIAAAQAKRDRRKAKRALGAWVWA